MGQVTVPWDSLSSDALQGVIEEYVTREGTEYGSTDVSLERKRAAVLGQLKSGKACITWDDDLKTCSIEEVP